MSNYQTWNTLNVANSESGTDFQKIARDSNFHFKTYKGRVNWNQIEKLNVDRLIDEQNVSILGHNIENVVNFDIESNVKILNCNFVKIFKLSQLTNDFLLHCKRHLSQQNYLLKLDLEKASKKITMLKKENVELKKIIHWNKWRPSGCPGEGHELGNNTMCEMCGKLFQFESYLVMHMNRRHPGVTPFQFRRSESFITHYDKEPGECGTPASTSVGGGYKPPPDHSNRYSTELESLRKLITSKLVSNITVESSDGVEIGGRSNTLVAGPQLDYQGSGGHQGLGSQVVEHSDLGLNNINDNVNEGSGLVGDLGGVDRRVAERPISPPTCNKTTEGVTIELRGKQKNGSTNSNEGISKEQYEKHLSTIEGAWKKQFQELDVKYQNEIRKLQKELKIQIDDNQKTVKKLISEVNIKDREKRNEEHKNQADRTKAVEKNEEGNDTKEIKEIKLISTFSDDPSDTQHDTNNRRIQNREALKKLIFSNPINMPMKSVDVIVESNNQVIKESRNLRGLSRQSSVYDLKRSQTKTDTSLNKNGITMSENNTKRTATTEVDENEFKEACTAASRNVSARGNNSDSITMVPKEISQKINTANFKSGSDNTNCKEPIKKNSNYDNIFEYLNANDEQTEKQLNNIKCDNKDRDKHQLQKCSSSFYDIEIFDFNTKTPNDVFYNDDFTKKLSRHEFGDDAIKTDDDNVVNPFEIVETMLKDLEYNKLLPISKHVHKSITESSKFSLPNQQSRMEENTLFSKPEESDPNASRSNQDNQSPMKQTLKHCKKYFGNMTTQTNEEDRPEISESSSSEVLHVIHPDGINTDSVFHDNIIGHGKMIPVQSEDYFPANKKPMTSQSSIIEQTGAKELSIIEEETETDNSNMTGRKRAGLGHDSGSSSDESSATMNNNSFETIQHNRRKEIIIEDTSDTEEDDTLSNDNQHLQQIKNRIDDGKADMDHKDRGSTGVTDLCNSSAQVGKGRDEENLEISTKDPHPYIETIVTIHEAPDKTTQDNANETIMKDVKENIKTNKEKINEILYLDCASVNKVTLPNNLGPQQEILRNNTTQKNSNHLKETSNDSEGQNCSIDVRKRSLVRQEVMDKFDKVLKELNLNPEWMSLPKNTFEQKMDIIMHDRRLKTKTLKNYESKKDAIKKKLESIWREGIQMEKEIEKVSQPNNVENKENDERFSNETQEHYEDYININVRLEKKIQNEQTELNEKTKNLNKELKNVLGLKKEKQEITTGTSTEKKLVSHENSSGKTKKKISSNDEIQNDDIQKSRHPEANNLISREPEGHDSNFTPNTQISSRRKNTVKNPEVVVILLKNENISADETAENVNEGSKSGTSSQQKKPNWQPKQNIEPPAAKSASVPKQSMTSKNIQDNMYHSEDILDRQTDYLQTNNFTSNQPIRKSSSRGYNILGKYIKTNGMRPTSSIKKRSSDSEVLDTTDKVKQTNQSRCKSTDFRGDNSYQPTHTIANANDNINTIPKLSTNMEKSLQGDMFLIKAPYDITSSTNPTFESNFLTKEAKNKGMYETKETNIIAYSLLDPTNKTLTGRKKLTTYQMGTNMVSNISQTNKLETNLWGTKGTNSTNPMKSGDNLKTSKKNSLSQDNFDYLNGPKRHEVAVERNQGDVEISKMDNDTPMMGTIRRMMTAAVNREDSDSSSSFELDDFLQKNNFG